MEHLQGIQLFTHADELDRLAGDRLDGEGCAALGVAVQLGQDHAGDVEHVIKAGGDIDRFLAGHGIGHEENFPRLYGILDLRQFVHQEIVDLVPAGGIEDDRVKAVQFGITSLPRADINRFLVCRGVEDLDAELPAEGFELFDGRRTVDVGRNQQGPPLLGLQVPAQLAAGRGLAGTLEADHHDRNRRFGRQVEAVVLATPHDRHQFVVDDLDDLLAGGEALENLGADRLAPDASRRTP